MRDGNDKDTHQSINGESALWEERTQDQSSQVQKSCDLGEFVAVLAMLLLMALFLFPVFQQARQEATKTTCLSNMRQLGIAFSQYTHDYGDILPISSMNLYNHKVITANNGWAGRLIPYVKDKNLFRCPQERTKVLRVWGDKATGSPVSYAINANMSEFALTTSCTTPTRTVLLYEVSGSHADLSRSDEGEGHVPQVSASGYGLPCYMAWVSSKLSNDDLGPNYATGTLDNQKWDGCDGYTTRVGDPRHDHKSNFLALDGHVGWLSGSSVSAGYTAQKSDADQTASGCVDAGQGNVPCAEGTEVGKHVLTFSTK